MIFGDLDASIQEVKKHSNLPVIIFPGSVNQVSKFADAILYLSLINSNRELVRILRVNVT